MKIRHQPNFINNELNKDTLVKKAYRTQ